MMLRFRFTSNCFINPLLLLRACANLQDLRAAKQVHAKLIVTGSLKHTVTCNALIHMYCKCESLKDARQVFDEMCARDAVSWNTLLSAFTHNGRVNSALDIFRKITVQQHHMALSQFCFSSVAKACGIGRKIEFGRQVHCLVIKTGFSCNVFVGSSVVDMYSKCLRIDDARQVFEGMPEANVVTWTAMISGYVQMKRCHDAVKLYSRFLRCGARPDEFVFSSLINGSGAIASLQLGRSIHAQALKAGLEFHKAVANSLIDMYSKSGSLKDALTVHGLMPIRDVVSWTAMVAACAQYGDAMSAFRIFDEMQESGIRPNKITYVCVLTACRHAGLVDEGCKYFNMMSEDHGINPTSEHYACMVDLLGRAGKIKEARALIEEMPVEPSAAVYGAFLGACKIHGMTEDVKWASERLLVLEPYGSGSHVLLHNMNACLL